MTWYIDRYVIKYTLKKTSSVRKKRTFLWMWVLSMLMISEALFNTPLINWHPNTCTYLHRKPCLPGWVAHPSCRSVRWKDWTIVMLIVRLHWDLICWALKLCVFKGCIVGFSTCPQYVTIFEQSVHIKVLWTDLSVSWFCFPAIIGVVPLRS